jgi:hypothetical protein
MNDERLDSAPAGPEVAAGACGARPLPAAAIADVLLAIPFDIDFDLDLARLSAERAARVEPPPLSGRNAPALVQRRSGIFVALDGREIAADAREEVWIYGFEVGLLIVRFGVPRELPRLADLACDAERIEIDGRPIYTYAGERAESVRSSLRPFARQSYEVRYDERDIYPIVVLPPGPDTADAASFIRANEAAIVGIVGGEDQWARLSSYALAKGEARNLGYYVDELIVVKEWGALVSSAFEEEAILGIVLLAYAQRWALQSWNNLTNFRQDQALKLLREAKAVRLASAALASGAIRDIARKLFEASEDRIALVAAIRDFTTIPELTQDWHLKSLYEELARTFYLNDLYRLVASKNEELERAYSAVHDHLMQSRLVTLEVMMLFLFLLEGLLLLVWFLSEVKR